MYIFISPTAYVTNGHFDISIVHPHMTSQTCCRAIYFVTELTRFPSRLLLKDFIKVRLQKFAVMRSHMTRKSAFGPTDPTTDVTNMFRLKSVWTECGLIHRTGIDSNVNSNGKGHSHKPGNTGQQII